MMVIGLGNQTGASFYHQAFAAIGFEPTLRSVGKKILETGKILLGVGIIEDQEHRTAMIRAVLPKDFYEQEKTLLPLARKWMPDLPFRRIDLLIVDEIGKNISGTGMDTTIIGRKHFIHGIQSPGAPNITRIYVRALTSQTRGNATGVGLADYTHDRLVKRIDFTATYDNCNTGDNPRAAAIPIHYGSDRQVLEAALQTIGCAQVERARIVWIRNTAELQTLSVSEAFRAEAAARDDLEILGPLCPLQFDAFGDLKPL